MSRTGLITQMGIVGIDHIAVTTNNFKETLSEYLTLPGTKLLRGPGWNERQKVDYAFVKTIDGIIIEILGARDGSPIESHIRHGGGVYHFCYVVSDIYRAIEAIKKNKGRIIVDPISDVAFDERPIAFAYHPDLGLFEIVGKSPNKDISMPKQSKVAGLGLRLKASNGELEDQLTELMQKELKIVDASLVKTASLGGLPNWDSLAHLKLAMAIETQFNLSIESGDLYNLRSFMDILFFIKGKVGNARNN